MIIVGKGKTVRELRRRTRGIRNDITVNFGGYCDTADFNRNLIHDKLEQYKIMRGKEIPQPEMWESDYLIIKYPCLGRKKHHSRGRDIEFIEDIFDAEESESDFFTQYIDKKSEYRVHVLGDICLVKRKAADPNMEQDPIIRSRGKGWRQISYDGRYKEDLETLAKKAVDALEMNFGVVDIIRDQNNELLVLEVNSSPALNETKMEVYIKYFQGL